ncbi:MAG: hypothetical protein LBG23_01200 [Endomicrobium sp.]|jgi:tetratricopeptide (TPR) repeat protein|nr:hypothetical protein [Endomicrobium sp.]
MFKIFLFTILLLPYMFICGCGSDNYNIFRRIAKTTATTGSRVSEGQTALANGNYDQAKEIFKQIIDTSPSDRKAIAGYITATVGMPELIGKIVEASQEFKDSGNKTIVNNYKNVDIETVHEMKVDLDYLLKNPVALQTMLNESDSQANVSNALVFGLAAVVTIADSTDIKVALGIVGDDVDFNKIINKDLPETLKTRPEAMDVISQASQLLDFAQMCATKIAGKDRVIMLEMVAKLQDALKINY